MRQPSKLRDSYATRVLRFKVSELAGIYFPRHKALNPVSQSSAAGKLTNLVKLPACCVAIISLALLGLTFATPAMAEFGIERFAVGVQNQNGTPDVQAGSHPYALTASFVLKQPPCIDSGELCLSESELKDARFELPPGVVGDPDAIPRCTYQEFVNLSVHETGNCANETAVGVATGYTGKELEVGGSGERRYFAISDPVFNLVPPPGVVAEFGFIIAGEVPVLLQASVRTGTDYGVTTSASDIPQAKWITATKVTIWGVPASPSHNPTRGDCEYSGTGHGVPESTNEAPDEVVGYGLRAGEDELETPAAAYPGSGRGLPVSLGDCESQAPQVPLLTLPTSCGVSRKAALDVDDWKEPGNFLTGEHVTKAEVSLPALTGCEKVGFSSSLSVKPEESAGSTPSGLLTEFRIPQEGLETATGLADSAVKDQAFVFPEGLQLNASSANGLESCSIAQIGFTKLAELNPVTEPGLQTPEFTPRLENRVTHEQEASLCPPASRIGNVHIKTPLLEGELSGGVYLAAPQNFAGGVQENPFNALIAVYVIAEEPKSGVLVKLAAQVTPNPITGQLVGTLSQIPPFPFSNAKLEFYGGERANFATPTRCGPYNTKLLLNPWSGAPELETSGVFNVTSGLGGGVCPGATLPFTPSLAAGVASVTAGGFTPLSTSMVREDDDQAFKDVSVTYPAGVTALLKGVPECPEAQANAGSCGSESLIGEATASSGLGQDPYTVTGGKVYLTGPYDGAPFGLSIAVPPKAGPFVLDEGAPVVVRAKIEVNPATAAVTVTTTGEIPHILDGIPLEIQKVNVTVNRPGFTLNPTSCAPASVTGSILGLEGSSFAVAAPFQVGDCANLAFQPTIAVSTGAHASKDDGVSLSFKIAYPAGSLGSQAWLKEVKVVVPKQLPSRLTTIQQACLAATFETNPAGCPTHSKIGEAVVHTQVLPEPLKGPVYFVSYGAAKFPDVVMALAGDNVKIDLTGETLIKNEVTSVTFPTVPGVPFETAEVTIPTGEYSEFGANIGLGNYDFCGQKLTMPTEFKGQNGLEAHDETPITITGCKPAITVLSHKVKGHTATLVVSVPAAGKLTATGKGLSKATGKATKAGDITVKLTLTKAEAATLSKRKGHKLRTKIALQFAPKTGSKLKTTTTVTLG
jgi:hypothetical protein